MNGPRSSEAKQKTQPPAVVQELGRVGLGNKVLQPRGTDAEGNPLYRGAGVPLTKAGVRPDGMELFRGPNDEVMTAAEILTREQQAAQLRAANDAALARAAKLREQVGQNHVGFGPVGPGIVERPFEPSGFTDGSHTSHDPYNSGNSPDHDIFAAGLRPQGPPQGR